MPLPRTSRISKIPLKSKGYIPCWAAFQAHIVLVSRGVYRVPFQWTMSGDWIVTVAVILPNGETHKKTFDFTVDD